MPDKAIFPPGVSTKRIDLHCHSKASTEADEAVLIALQCPESFSEPLDVYAQAKSRGMDFVTITDHDSIVGVSEILPGRSDVLVGEELTCYFREDRCKMHVLVWGITPEDHAVLQSLADDIELVADYIADNRIAHSVAHPLYRQNDKLERWHLERLLLLFNGFEVLNGAHSTLHRDAFTPVIDGLDESEIRHLRRKHDLRPRWSEPWNKTRTGGSDDHGLFNIGRTYTEFPAGVNSISDVLACLRSGDCRPGGEVGSSVKLAHNFYGVGVRYFSRTLSSPKSIGAAMLQKLVGEKPKIGKRALAMAAAKHAGRTLVKKVGRAVGLSKKPHGTALLAELLVASASQRVREHRSILDVFKAGRSPLAEHGSMFDLISDINRDVCRGVTKSLSDSLGQGQVSAIFDSLSTVFAHQSLLLPYYFALFHQNQERHLMPRITGRPRDINRETIRVGLFTDKFAGNSAAGRFAATIAAVAREENLKLVTHTCGIDSTGTPSSRNFEPLVSQSLGSMGEQLAIPPVLEILEWSDRQQFDVIVSATPGPMGICGWLVSKMLRVPMLNVLHDDLPASVLARSGGDYRLTAATESYNKWVYSAAAKVIARSRVGVAAAQRTGATADRIALLPPSHSILREESVAQTPGVFEQLRVREPIRVICPAGKSMSAKEAKMLVDAFAKVAENRRDVALIVHGTLRATFKKLPIYVIENDIDTPERTFAGADLVVYPFSGDITGQVVLDAQAVGVPVIVGSHGAGAEMIDDEVSGTIVPEQSADAWAAAILDLLNDEPRRQRMARTSPHRAARLTPLRLVNALWAECVATANAGVAVYADQTDEKRKQQTAVAEVS